MFKRLKKSVIDKNNSLLSNLTKKRVNKTPSKIIFPYRTNLAFANIIVNMNSTPSFRNIESWNNSYFNTDLYNNSFSNKTSSNCITDISRNTCETKDDHSEILSLIINGILCLKSNDLMNYFFKLIEIITYNRDNQDKYNYIDINSSVSVSDLSYAKKANDTFSFYTDKSVRIVKNINFEFLTTNKTIKPIDDYIPDLFPNFSR